MLDRLESAFERERTFIADASHELRAPIALLKAELELARRRPCSEAEVGDVLRSAVVETDPLARLADDLLVLARSDDGALVLDVTAVSPHELLASVTTRFARRASDADRPIELDASDEFELRGDSLRLEQALANLVDNALRHGSGSIRLTAAKHQNRIELHVLDEGGGFAPEFLPHVFERFSRADSSRGGNGAGLGLPIAEVIAQAHGGSAHAANRPGGGADVWLEIPA
jgi:signal transduction histidine kinase